MDQNDEIPFARNRQFSLRYLIAIVISFAAVCGWISAVLENRKLKSEREALLPGATRQALDGLELNIVGDRIDDHPLIKLLGNREELPGERVDILIDDLKDEGFPFPDFFGNEPAQWEKIDRDEIMICYILRPENDPSSDQRDYQIIFATQDGVILLIKTYFKLLHL